MTAKRYSPTDMLAELVRFDTTSRESNLDLIRFVEDYLKGYGISSHLVYDEEGGKANLVATVGPDALDGIVLSGHSDVVPVDGQTWNTNPFEMVEKDGLLYGRGTCDMKGYIATALALVPEFLVANLKTPVHIVLTYDEETTCGGADRLMPELLKLGFNPRAVIIGEPTMMKLVNAHKGTCTVQTKITGEPAHTSMPHLGVNAISVASELIAELARIQEDLKAHPSPLRGFDPPHSTITVGLINGGTQFNIVPGSCTMGWDIRSVPGDDPMEFIERLNAYAAEIIPRMQAVSEGATIETEVLHHGKAFVPVEDSPAEELVKAVSGINETLAVGFGTEAVCYQDVGMSAVVYGPGSIEQAHKPDEFISTVQLDECTGFMRDLMTYLAR
jgi:acetylornithine deacetylase